METNTNTTTPATPNNRQGFAAALADLVLPPNATDAEIDLLKEKIREVAAPSAAVALKIARPAPAPPVEVIAEFMLGGVPHDAVLTPPGG